MRHHNFDKSEPIYKLFHHNILEEACYAP